MPLGSRDIRLSFLAKWHKTLSEYGTLFSSDSVSGTSPPSVFVGSYNYPQVHVGPMVPSIHGDTGLLDSPERWSGKSLDEIINFRLSLVRGTKKIPVDKTEGRYVEDLQELSMSSKPTDSDLVFSEAVVPHATLDGQSAPFGPVGKIKSAKFSPASPAQAIERAFYDRDLTAQDAVVNLYNSGIEISKIQRCFSIGMLGQKRKLVPTKWSITATDDIISSSLLIDVLENSLVDSCRVFSYAHLGNCFSVILFPHRWIYEMIEAWHSDGVLVFGSDHEDARGIGHPPAIAGAYFAAKLAVLEYLHRHKIQAGVVVLREIRPEYSIPVGVWQIREGIREAMSKPPIFADTFESALKLAASELSTSHDEWLSHGNILKLTRQQTLSDFF